MRFAQEFPTKHCRKSPQHSRAPRCCCVLPGACRGTLWLRCWNWPVRLIDDQSLTWSRLNIAQWLTGCLSDWLAGRLVIFFFLHSAQVHFLVPSVCLQAPPRRTVRSSRLRPGGGTERSRSGRSTVCGGNESPASSGSSAPSSVHRPESATTCSVETARIK